MLDTVLAGCTCAGTPRACHLGSPACNTVASSLSSSSKGSRYPRPLWIARRNTCAQPGTEQPLRLEPLAWLHTEPRPEPCCNQPAAAPRLARCAGCPQPGSSGRVAHALAAAAAAAMPTTASTGTAAAATARAATAATTTSTTAAAKAANKARHAWARQTAAGAAAAEAAAGTATAAETATAAASWLTTKGSQNTNSHFN